MYADSLGCPETVISGKIQITKKIVNTIDNLSAPEAGAKFSVTDSKGNVVDTITIGENGVGISKDLPYGSYTVAQISGQAGTIRVDSWTVTVNEHGKVYEYTKENPLWTAFVFLHKKEAGSKTPLVGTFELCERLPDGTVRVLETGTTDADGNLAFTRRIVYTDGACNKSTYFIRESVAPAGYVLDTKEYNKALKDVKIEIFSNEDCTDKVATWLQDDGKFTVTYSSDDRHMTIDITEAGLDEINGNQENINGKLFASYSNYTMRVTYTAT